MAEFCKQCAKEVWGNECPGDFIGITSEEDYKKGLYSLVLCEGCGPCQVRPDGSCIGNCMNPGHNKKEENDIHI
jgi:hypothetical protein